MIGYFPEIYPEETLYSAISRYCRHTMADSYKAVNADLFGYDFYPSASTHDLPRSLGAFVGAVNHVTDLSLRIILENNTLWPFFRNFTSEEHVNSIEKQLIETNNVGPGIHLLSGLNASSFKRVLIPKYCILCASDDEKIYGEPYWKRTHLIPNIEICPKHHVHLSLPQDVHSFHARNRYIPLSQIKRDSHITICSNPNQIKLAEQLAKYLNKYLNVRSNNYSEALVKLGFRKTNGGLDFPKLASDLQEYISCFYPVANHLKKNNSWIRDLCTRPSRVFDPLRHSLIELFINEKKTVTSTIKLLKSPFQTMFGAPPFKCINKASNHYNEAVILDCRFYVNKKAKRITGKFSCQCGMEYTLSYDPLIGHSSEYRRIVCFGEQWLSQLQLLIQSKHSLRSTARQLGMDPRTIIHQANILGIKHPWKDEAASSSLVSSVNFKQTQCDKKAWDKILSSGKYKIKEARMANKALYARLYRSDKDWLITYNSQYQVKENSKPRKNWPLLDEKVLQLLIKVVQNFPQTNRQRMSRNFLLHALSSQCSVNEKNFKKMPLTSQFLLDHAETVIEYQKRRVVIVAEELKQSDTVLRNWVVIRKAGLKPPIAQSVLELIQQITDEDW
jgi:hypothetical protein